MFPGLCIKYSNFFRCDLKVSNEIIDLLYSCVTLLSRDEAGNDGIPIFHVVLNSFGYHDEYCYEKNKRIL